MSAPLGRSVPLLPPPATRSASPVKSISTGRTAGTNASVQSKPSITNILDSRGNTADIIDWLVDQDSEQSEVPESSGIEFDTATPSQGLATRFVASNDAQLGLLSYHLTDLLAFHVLPVQVVYHADGKINHIRSQRLKYRAIEESIQESELKHSKDRIFKRIDNSRDPMGEIIISSVNGHTLPTELDVLQSHAFELMLPKVSFHNKATTDGDREGESFPITCKIRPGQYPAVQIGGETYLRYLDILIRRNASSNDVSDTNMDSQYGLRVEFLNPAQNTKICGLTGPKAGQGPFQDLHCVELKIRHKAELVPAEDPNPPSSPSRTHTPPVAVLKLDFDLVLVMKKSTLSDIVFEIFGHGVLGSSVVKNYDAIKHTLLGLHVQPLYDTRSAIRADARKEKQAHSHTKTSLWEKKPRPTIYDLRMPGEVESFQARDEERKIKTYSVTKYFNEVIFANKGGLKYQGLPLANIRRPGTGLERWIPLEILFVHRPQVLRSSGHATNS